MNIFTIQFHFYEKTNTLFVDICVSFSFHFMKLPYKSRLKFCRAMRERPTESFKSQK
jgi:hypothetical protein